MYGRVTEVNHDRTRPQPVARSHGADEPAAGAVTGSLHDPSATRDFPEASADRATGEAAGRLPAIDGYDVLNVLGRGGMGVVYRARHIRLNRVVALKVILSGSHAAEYELARFQTEAETIARLSHPHIVQVYEVGQAEGRPYLALEFVDGGSLDHRLTGDAPTRRGGGPFRGGPGPGRPLRPFAGDHPPRPETGEHPAFV